MRLRYVKADSVWETANCQNTSGYEVLIGRWKLGFLLEWSDKPKCRFYGSDNDYDEIEVEFESRHEFEKSLAEDFPEARPKRATNFY